MDSESTIQLSFKTQMSAQITHLSDDLSLVSPFETIRSVDTDSMAVFCLFFSSLDPQPWHGAGYRDE